MARFWLIVRKLIMSKRLLFSIMIILSYSLLRGQQTDVSDKDRSALKYTRPIENTVNYNNALMPKKALDYELLALDEHSFKVKFINHPSEYLDIKIYDVIGNLIMTETVRQSRNSELEYQFDEIRSKIFVIKVKSGGEYLTKKINL